MIWTSTKRAQIVAVLGLLCSLLSLAPSQAGAQSVVVLDFEGPRSGRARADVIKALRAGDVELIEQAQAEAQAQELGVSLDSDTGRSKVAAKIGASAFLNGTTVKRKKRMRLTLIVYNGRDGTVVGEARVGARKAKFSRRIRRGLMGKLTPLLNETDAPDRVQEPDLVDESSQDSDGDSTLSRAAEESAETQARDDAGGFTEDDIADGAGGKPWLQVGFNVGLMARSLTFKDSVIPLSDHSLGMNLAPSLYARVYPMALAGDGPLANIGLELSARRLLFAASKRDEIEFATNVSDYRIGLHGRLAVGEHSLGLGVGYGVHSGWFSDADDGTKSGVAGVRYKHLRFAVDGTVDVGPLSLEPTLGLLLPLAYGEIGDDDWFQHVSGMGYELGLQAAVPLSDSFELTAGAAFRQWGLALNPKPDDTSVTAGRRAAGGITDRYTTLDLGIRFSH